jgi:hypothetical protein
MRRVLGVAAVVLAVLFTGLHAVDLTAAQQPEAAAHTTVDDLHLTTTPSLVALPGPRARPEPAPFVVLLVVALALAAAGPRSWGDGAERPLTVDPPPLALRRRGPPTPA